MRQGRPRAAGQTRRWPPRGRHTTRWRVSSACRRGAPRGPRRTRWDGARRSQARRKPRGNAPHIRRRAPPPPAR